MRFKYEKSVNLSLVVTRDQDFVEQDLLMSPNPSGKLEDLVVVVCVCLVI